ncbi:27590_t:CDS:1, partial [Gigaspora margarita]
YNITLIKDAFTTLMNYMKKERSYENYQWFVEYQITICDDPTIKN